MDGPSNPIAPPKPNVATLARIRAGNGRRSMERSRSWKLRMYSSAVPEQQVVASSSDAAVIERLLAGDETAFMMLVGQHQPAMLRLAQMYVSSRAVAEEVVQEAWIGILKGLPAFEGRASLRTWMY